jgi:phosphoglycolate phosphatase-like HAD superfamily hydrolase/SAM-dependent methyltransferase
MKLIIFDVDGTLTATNDVDAQCFVQAFNDEFGITNINTDWHTYGHTTDSGITLQIFQEHLGRIPQASEVSRLEHHFLELLRDRHKTTVEIPGAAVTLQRLTRSPEWGIALASGGWRSCAKFKLQAVIDIHELPGAFADDGISREEIVTKAISRACSFYQQPNFDKIIYVGDGIWNVLTAIQLQLAFVGIVNKEKTVLQNAGVDHLIEDFQCFDYFLQACNNATIPKQHKPEQVKRQSLPPSYFEALYDSDPDPWKFETSVYEAQKYTATITALSKNRYQSALEIGGSIGVLTEKLASICDSLLSVDVSKIAQDKARIRCQDFAHVRFEIMQIPTQFPDENFDLILVSEVGYYLCPEDLKKAQQEIIQHLQPGGHLLLVHWTQFARDYPLSGDEVHESFLDLTPTRLRHLKSQREEQYRLDLFERV